MSTGAESQVFQPSADASATDVPAQPGSTNLFAPISTHNRITGQSRSAHRHTPTQLAPGSSYDYGRNEYLDVTVREDYAYPPADPLGYQKGIPPTFLHRTMADAGVSPAAEGSQANRWNDSSPTMIYNAALLRQHLGSYSPAGSPSGGQPAAAGPTARESRGWKPIPKVPPAQEVFGWGNESVAYATAPEAPADASEASDSPVQPTAFQAAPVTLTPPARTPAARNRRTPPPEPPVQQAEPALATQALADTPPADVPAQKTTRATGAKNRAPRSQYVPKHGRHGVENQNLAEIPGIMEVPGAMGAPQPFFAAEHMPDTWELMGWKTSDPMENTAVMRVRDLTMFERGAFEDPPSPFNTPPEPAAAQGMPGIGAYGEVGPVSGSGGLYGAEAMPSGYQVVGSATSGYAPYDPQALGGYPAPSGYPPADVFYGEAASGELPYGTATDHPREAVYDAERAHADDPPRQAAAPPRRAPPTSAHSTHAKHGGHRPPPKKQRMTLAAFGPWRVGVLLLCSLALLFCVIEVGKIVHTMLLNDQEMKQYRESGFSTAADGGVDLLPAGVTYAPTATTVPVYTPTPTPIIDQNDPMIGVLDGGATASQYQAVLPTPTPVTRTRLTQYPNNALLSVDADFTDLLAENADVVGRLIIDGVLDETVVQRNNTFYLNHNARGVQGSSGALFVDESCVLRKPPENLLIRGQITPEGKLFSSLSQYGTQGADFVRQHGIVTCNTLYEKARYAVFAIIHADSRANSAEYFNYAGYPTFQSDAQMLRYVEAARQHSVYTIDVGVNASDRLLTLATLAEGSDTTCWVVLCRMLRNGETDGNIQRQ